MTDEAQATAVKNTVTVEDVGPCRKKVTVEIPAETVKAATDQQYEDLRKEAVVPGFRKGKAPRKLLEKRFGKEAAEQIKLKLLAEASESALKDNSLDALREPDIDYEKIELPDSGPLKFDFEVEVPPEFELPELEGIPVTKRQPVASDQQIEAEIEQLRRWSGLWTPREDEPVHEEDQVIADVVLRIEGVEEEQKLDNLEIYARANGFVGGVPVEKLNELLAGATVGQTLSTTVTVPKTFYRQEYRGKQVEITITIREVKWLKPAEIDENFLGRYGVENEQQLREKVRDILQERLERQVRQEMTEQIYRYLLDNTDFELPEEIVADQSNDVLRRQYANLLMRGLRREEIDQQMDQLRAASEQQAKQQLKTFFIMDKVAAKLGIDVTEEEVNGYIAQMAIRQGQRPERLREQMLRDGSLSQFRLQVREQQCISRLLSSAKIVEAEAPKKTKKTKSKSTKKSDSGSKSRSSRSSKAKGKQDKQ